MAPYKDSITLYLESEPISIPSSTPSILLSSYPLIKQAYADGYIQCNQLYELGIEFGMRGLEVEMKELLSYYCNESTEDAVMAKVVKAYILGLNGNFTEGVPILNSIKEPQKQKQKHRECVDGIKVCFISFPN